jgi:hypothetical protein
MDAAYHHALLYHVNVDVAGDRDAGVTRAPWASSSVPDLENGFPENAASLGR